VSRYANDTGVPIDRSRSEIERTLTRYGAKAFMYATKPEKAMIAFEVEGRHIRMILPMPTDADDSIRLNRWGRANKNAVIEKKIEQEARRRWRALALVIKAKLEAVSSGIAVFDDEFLAYMMLPDGRTVGEWAQPQIKKLGEKMPKMLPAGMD
jgi:hypothetical protein